MKLYFAILICALVFAGCKSNQNIPDTEIKPIPQDTQNTTKEQVPESKLVGTLEPQKKIVLINPDGMTIGERFHLPEGYSRVPVDDNPFGEYLRNLPLKPDGSRVKYYDGREKQADVYLAVVDFALGDRDLQQCADAVIRLRAEYLYSKELYDEIAFHFVNGFNADFSKWSAGFGISVDGNNVTWVQNDDNNSSYESFQKYLNIVYAYASTLSLTNELKPKDINDMKIGDVFIKGGSPGHAVIVVDMAVNESNGKRLFMLAQSYMPAQDIQILKGQEDSCPWYVLQDQGMISTPEWKFDTEELKSWQ